MFGWSSSEARDRFLETGLSSFSDWCLHTTDLQLLWLLCWNRLLMFLVLPDPDPEVRIRICWLILTFLKVFHLHSFSLLGRRGRRWRNFHFAGTSPVCVRTKVASGAAINVPRNIGFMTAIEDCNTVEDTGGSIYGIDKRVRIRIHNTHPGSWIQKQHWKPRVKKNFVIKSFILEQ